MHENKYSDIRELASLQQPEHLVYVGEFNERTVLYCISLHVEVLRGISRGL